MICLGAVIRGATPHFDYVAAEVTKGVAMSVRTGVPVIFGVLTTDTIEQAVERAGTKAGNKGWTAACRRSRWPTWSRRFPEPRRARPERPHGAELRHRPRDERAPGGAGGGPLLPAPSARQGLLLRRASMIATTTTAATPMATAPTKSQATMWCVMAPILPVRANEKPRSAGLREVTLSWRPRGRRFEAQTALVTLPDLRQRVQT